LTGLFARLVVFALRTSAEEEGKEERSRDFHRGLRCKRTTNSGCACPYDIDKTVLTTFSIRFIFNLLVN
jgi:hypothetical protein